MNNRTNPLKPVFIFAFFILIITVSLYAPSIPSPSHEEDLSSYKNFVDKTISPKRIDRYLKYFTEEPHMASSARNNELADFILREWKAFGLDDAYLDQYDVFLSFPKKIDVEMVSPRKHRLELKEAGYKEDPDTLRHDVGLPYNAYSRSGEITSYLVYANSGNPQDYDWLEREGIELKGKIALVRYSSPYSYRGFKAYTAEKRGLAALLIYSDPMEDGFARGLVFPHGPWGPMSHIQRGGIPYDFIYPGDPLTPGWASKPGCRRVPQEKALTLPKIISVPISAQDALPLLQAMGGKKAPEGWKGALPVTYRLGGSQVQIHMKVSMETPIRRITNVIGCIKGIEDGEGFVLVGNHRDAWVFGGHDPSSGTACLMELVRSLAETKNAGYKPKRDVYFASWDAEEFTLTGSTEWGEDHREWIEKNLVAYLNVDSAASGRDFSVRSVPSLSQVIMKALQEVKDPVSGEPVYVHWKSGSEEKGTIVVAGGGGKIHPIGSGTDHAVFLNHIGAPALDMSFSGDYGVYHSMYDNYYWMTHFGDPGMLYTATLAKIWAHMVIDLACSPILPLDFECYAQELESYLGDWTKQYDPSEKRSKGLFTQIREMKEQASRLTPTILGLKIWEKEDGERVRKINRILMDIERDFTVPQGIPGRNWYKHLVFGTRFTYAVLLLPALQEAAEAGDQGGISRSLAQLEEAVKKAILKIQEISKLLVIP